MLLLETFGHSEWCPLARPPALVPVGQFVLCLVVSRLCRAVNELRTLVVWEILGSGVGGCPSFSPVRPNCLSELGLATLSPRAFTCFPQFRKTREAARKAEAAR